LKDKEIEVLKKVNEGIHNKKELQKSLGIQVWQTNYLINGLIKKDYLEVVTKKIEPKKNTKSILFREVLKKYDVNKLLHDSNETIFTRLIRSQTTPATIDSLSKETSLSESTVYKSINELESIGAIQRTKYTIKINADPTDSLFLFAALLYKEKENENLTDDAEIIYKDSFILLKKVVKQNKVEGGELTAFSLFSEYGLQYNTTYDYYVEQMNSITLEDILIHSILISKKDQDINELIMSMLFYVSNKKKMNLVEIKKIARKVGVSDLWSDIEIFIRNKNIEDLKNKKLFSNREEFVLKAKLYNIPSEAYELPNAFPDLFKEIDKKITGNTKVSIYIIGGENMRIKGLKHSTKDCDLVLNDESSMKSISDALYQIGFTTIDDNKLSRDDQRVGPAKKFVYPGKSDIELFYSKIGNKLSLTEQMKERASRLEIEGLSNLQLYLLSNEDIFLLKGVTSREGDLDDMRKLVEKGEFDWDVIYEELERQTTYSNGFLGIIMDSIDDLKQRTGIKPPIYKKLLRKEIDINICRAIGEKKGLTRDKGIYLDELIDLLKGPGVSEKLIRNRVESLLRSGKIKRSSPDNRVHLRLTPKYNIEIKDTLSQQPLDEWYTANYNSIYEYLQMICKNLKLSDSILGESTKIAKQVSMDPTFIGNRPRNIAAGIINVVIKTSGIKRTQKEISYAANVSEPSITQFSQRVRRNLSRY
jgi:predicted transcriptional regulator